MFGRKDPIVLNEENAKILLGQISSPKILSYFP